MSLAIVGLGTALPPTLVTQTDALQLAKMICCRTEDQADLLLSLHRQTGIATRHLAFPREVVADVLEGTRKTDSVFLPGCDEDDRGPTTRQRMEHYVQLAGPLAVRAARDALEDSALPPGEFSHLVTVSCTGFSAPGVDCELIKHLELPRTIERTHIGFMGCHGAFNGLRVANAFACSLPGARILLCAVELCAIHYHYGWNPKKMVSNALFADGAAAVVGVPAAAAEADSWQVAASGACLLPECEQAMTWNIGDHGFEMTLATRVPDLIVKHLRPWLDSWLGQNRLSKGDVASWAIHPGGPRILTAVEEALNLDKSTTAVSREILESCGNMSSPTVLFILGRLRARRARRPCVALGFGPGLTVEATLFR